MPVKQIDLGDFVFTLTYVDVYDAGRADYLHRVRSPVSQMFPFALEDARIKYEAALPRLVEGLTAETPDEEYDIIAQVPSSRPELIEPYYKSLRSRFPESIDISAALTKDPLVKAGDEATDSETLEAAWDFEPPSKPEAAASVLLVDDLFATGKTIRVLGKLLRNQYGDDLMMTLACPLKMP